MVENVFYHGSMRIKVDSNGRGRAICHELRSKSSQFAIIYLLMSFRFFRIVAQYKCTEES